MNIDDLRRVVDTSFGSCEDQCKECNSCRAFAMVKMAWEAGKRSGSRGAVKKEGKKVEWKEWKWKADYYDLCAYGVSKGLTTPQVAMCIEEAQLWAEAGAVKKVNWTKFMQKWLLKHSNETQVTIKQVGMFTPASRTQDISDRRRASVLKVAGVEE